MKLLKYTNDSISDIAYNCGYSSPSIFSRSFKQYLEVSPSSYRKSGKIKNSKIRKELFPVEDYHCNMNEDELKASFPVDIRDFPERRIAYIRVLDSYKDGLVLEAFEKLMDWSKKMKLFSSETIFEMSSDAPMVAP